MWGITQDLNAAVAYFCNLSYESSREYRLKALVLNAIRSLLLRLPGESGRLLEEFVGVIECYTLDFIGAKAGLPHFPCDKGDTERSDGPQSAAL